MKILYLDCGMGAAGDMLTAALLELLPERAAFLDELNSAGIPNTRFTAETSVKCGITGTHVSVAVCGEEEESLDFTHDGAHDNHNHGHAHEHHNHDRVHVHEADHCHDHESCGHVRESYDSYGHEIRKEETCEHVHVQSCKDHIHSHSCESHVHGSYEHAHCHSSLYDIEHIVREHLNVSEKVKDDVLAVYGLIAEAESKAHGVPVTEIHFHEVGALDAVADITAVCMLIEKLSPDKVAVSPVHLGSGQVKCAHGILPVPAPATAHILRGVPAYGGSIKGELCTPTGAALIKHFASEFGSMPIMEINAVGYGMGKKDFEAANCVRAILGETSQAEEKAELAAELCCNIDDMTAETLGFAMERLLEEGALDVYTVPIGMKKSRPGVLLSVICREEEREKMAGLIFKYTSTIGIREQISRRYTLSRRVETEETAFGTVRKKLSEGYGVKRQKYEYEDIAQIARREGISTDDVLKALSREKKSEN